MVIKQYLKHIESHICFPKLFLHSLSNIFSAVLQWSIFWIMTIELGVVYSASESIFGDQALLMLFSDKIYVALAYAAGSKYCS